MPSIKDHIKSTMNLAYPVMIGQLGYIMMQVVDNMMVGGLGDAPLAAASLANGLFLIILIVGIGVSYAVTPLVAISIGANKKNESERIFQQSILVNIVLGIILIVITYFCSNIFQYLNQPIQVYKLAASYSKILGYSILPIMLFQTYKQFIEGLSITRPAMVITIIANLINAIINWILVYGHYGFPKLELNGSGWATFSSRLFMAIAIIWYVKKSARFRQFDVRLKFHKINFQVVKNILSLGLPSAVQYVFEVGAFSFAIVMIGWLGTKQLAAHQIAINLASITYMATLGISSAGAIRVGVAVGKQNISEVRQAGFTAILLGAAIMFCCGIIFISFNKFFPSLYIRDDSVITIASQLLIIAAIFQIFDGTQAVGIGVLRGLTDVKVPTLITFFAYWIIALPVGYILGFLFNLNVIGVWIGFLIGLMTSAILLTIRFNIKSRKLISI